MKLQVAIDLLSTADALALLNKVAEHVDVIELGTPLIKQQGLSVVTNVKAAYPDKLVFADMKTMDAGELEADLAFKAGADIMTVLATAADSTIAGAVKAGKAHGKAVVADMIGVADKAARLHELKAMGVSWVELHAGLDEQAQAGYSIEKLLEVGRSADMPFSVAGGINAERIGGVESAGATIAVAGAAIYGAKDPGAAAAGLRKKIKQLG
ncbi:3-hexulose-6-phosphate synthase [Edaphobacter modestus]|uniref:3-hexulose-6-phosphate synthase n=1 Tax=Edaphobacter modestus TaxID=388466 RepID=A0A4Q7YUC5_9BACT|nr:3-hexulose-6-phosphate synthase [Edaphobacter modestus]RZU41377.1 3-hexulose-6-phosphate synthase [Edaphobacter modestus]